MKLKTFLTLLAIACFVWSVRVVLHNQQRLNARLTQNAKNVESPTASDTLAPSPGAVGGGVSSELLRLRAEVTRLSARKRELEGAALHPEASIKGSISTNMMPLPPGYLRKSKAQFAGYSTPENTLESLLWAVNTQNANSFLQCFTEQIAASLRGQLVSESDQIEFFKKAKAIPGMLIGDKEEIQEGRIDVKVEIIPNMPGQNIGLVLENTGWKIASPL